MILDPIPVWDYCVLSSECDKYVEKGLTGTWASTVAANGWAGLPTPIPSGSRGTNAAGTGMS